MITIKDFATLDEQVRALILLEIAKRNTTVTNFANRCGVAPKCMFRVTEGKGSLTMESIKRIGQNYDKESKN